MRATCMPKALQHAFSGLASPMPLSFLPTATLYEGWQVPYEGISYASKSGYSAGTLNFSEVEVGGAGVYAHHRSQGHGYR